MKLKIWLALISIYIIWGSTYLAISIVGDSFPPFGGMAVRFIAAGLIVVIWRKISGDPGPSWRQWRDTFIIGFLLLMGGTGLLSWSEQKIPSGVAALLIASTPMWLVIFESMRPGGTKPAWQSILGILIGFGGIVLLIGPTGFAGGNFQFDKLSVLACLLGTILWASGSIYSRTASLPESTIQTAGMEMLAGGLGLLVVSLLFQEWNGFNLSEISRSSVIAMLYLIFIGSLVGYISYAFLLKHAPVSLVSTYAFVNPIVAIFLGSLFAGETLNGRIIVAASIIVGAVVLINTAKSARPILEEETASIPD